MKLKNAIAIAWLATILVFSIVSATAAQEAQPFAPDPIEQLQLTPEQRQSIRLIVQQTQPMRQQTNRRVREANIALDQALDAEPADEALVEQRINELATAQAAQLRMRIQTEMKIRRILRSEQLATLRRLRLQVRDVMAPQQRPNARPPARDALRPQQ